MARGFTVPYFPVKRATPDNLRIESLTSLNRIRIPPLPHTSCVALTLASESQLTHPQSAGDDNVTRNYSLLGTIVCWEILLLILFLLIFLPVWVSHL